MSQQGVPTLGLIANPVSARLAGVEVRNEGGGLRAFVGGSEVMSQQSFWFAWSQFKPGTLLWQRAP